jgi:xylulokinase
VTEALTVVQEFIVRFDEDLPHYGYAYDSAFGPPSRAHPRRPCRTKSGVLMGDGGVVTSPVAMWVEAVDLLFSKIAAAEDAKDLLCRVAALSGAAQVTSPLAIYPPQFVN